MIKAAIIGSRTFNDYQYLKKILSWFHIKRIISGGSQGADTLAKQYAAEHNIPIKEHLPNWDRDGKSAGFIRNKLIVADSDEVICFWDNASKGTAHSISLAKEAGKPVHIFWPTDDDLLMNIGSQKNS